VYNIKVVTLEQSQTLQEVVVRNMDQLKNGFDTCKYTDAKTTAERSTTNRIRRNPRNAAGVQIEVSNGS
jgi:hypothetical protein